MNTHKPVSSRWAAWTIAAAGLLAVGPMAAQETLPAPQSESPAGQPSSQDIAVAERVRDTLLGDMAMEGIQLLVSVMNGTVELLGVARDQAQADRAVELTRQVPGVIDVVHYIEVEGARPAAHWV